MATPLRPPHSASDPLPPSDAALPQPLPGEAETTAQDDLQGLGDVIDSGPAEPEAPAQPGNWWGTYAIAPGEQGRWQIGPLTLWLQRLTHEWRLAVDNAREQAFDISAPINIAAPTRVMALPEGIVARRYGFANTVGTVRLSPMMADRSVVTKTEQPLYVFAGEEVTIYVSFALWVHVAVGEPLRGLHEAPVFRLSDTFFGSNTMAGELAYASRATGRLEVTDMPARPYRAIGAVKVRNAASDAMLIERLKTPCRLLSLYQDDSGALWTNTQVLERGPGKDVHFQVETGAPKQAINARLLSGPRDTSQASLLQRAFGSFVG